MEEEEKKELEENNNGSCESESNKEPEADRSERAAVSRSSSEVEIITDNLCDSHLEEKLLVNMSELGELSSCLASDSGAVSDVESISHQIIDNIIENAVALVEGFRAVQDNISLLSLTDVLQSEDEAMCVDRFNVKKDNLDNLDAAHNQIRQESNFTKESGQFLN